MINFFKSFFKSAEDRVNNPVIMAFIISWVVLNWKPVLFLIFSSQNIEGKIAHIGETYKYTNFSLFLPIGIALFYVVCLPYINLGIEYILKYGISKGNTLIKDKAIEKLTNDGEIEYKKIEVEETKKKALEGEDYNEKIKLLNEEVQSLTDKMRDMIKGHSDIIESKDARIKNLEDESRKLTLSYDVMIDELRSELTESKKRQNDIAINYQKQINATMDELNELKRIGGNNQAHINSSSRNTENAATIISLQQKNKILEDEKRKLTETIDGYKRMNPNL